MGPEEGDIVKVISMVALLLTVAAVIVYTSHRSRLQEKARSEAEKKAIEAGVKKGICDEHGNPLCVICKELGEDVIATECTPITGQSWWDKLPFIQTARLLWAQADRDIVVDDVSSGPRLCRSHKTTAKRKLSEAHAACRAQLSAISAELREKIDYMDNGGTEAAVLATSKKIKASLGFEDALSVITRPQLSSPAESFALPVSSSSEHHTHEEDEPHES
jgi:hypothetical protein